MGLPVWAVFEGGEIVGGGAFVWQFECGEGFRRVCTDEACGFPFVF